MEQTFSTVIVHISQSLLGICLRKYCFIGRVVSVPFNSCIIRPVYEYLQTKTGKKKLYNFLTKELLEKIKYSDFKDVERVNLIVDRRKDGADRKDFNAYIKSHLETSFSMVTEVYISHESSLDSPGLQAVDLFCWGIQRKEELNDEEWFNCFNSNVSRYIPYLRS